MKPSLSLPTYPTELEDWWWNQAVQKWPEYGEEKIINLIRKEVITQSDRFNKTRSFDPQSYGARDLSLLTYGNFFFPRTWNAMTVSIAEAFSYRGWSKPKKGPIRVLDIGSGSGASGLSVLHFLKKFKVPNPVTLDAWDYSGKSLAFLKNIHSRNSQLWPQTKVTTQRTDLRDPRQKNVKERFDLILVGYSLNEISQCSELEECVHRIESLADLLSPNGFMIITEPADKNTCMTLQSIATAVSTNSKKLYNHAPYFNGLQCPLNGSDSHYYSHEVRKTGSPQRVERINQPLRLETHQVKFGMAMLSTKQPQPQPKDFSVCRIVSPVSKKKGTVSFIGIAGDGLEYRYEIQRRILHPDQIKILTKLERGDILNVDSGEIGKDKNRIRIPSFTSISWPFSPRWDIRE